MLAGYFDAARVGLGTVVVALAAFGGEGALGTKKVSNVCAAAGGTLALVFFATGISAKSMVGPFGRVPSRWVQQAV